jgi:thioredoxin 1
MSTLHLTEKSFESEVLNSATPVLVDFWAEWCGPCKMIGPIIDELGKEMQGKLKVAKVNVDNEGELAAKFNIMSIPTMLIFKNGKVVNQIIGALPKDQLLAKITPNLS